MIRASITIELVGTDQADLTLMRRLMDEGREKNWDEAEVAVATLGGVP